MLLVLPQIITLFCSRALARYYPCFQIKTILLLHLHFSPCQMPGFEFMRSNGSMTRSILEKFSARSITEWTSPFLFHTISCQIANIWHIPWRRYGKPENSDTYPSSLYGWPGKQNPYTERLLFAARAGKYGDWSLRIINIQMNYLPYGVLILFLVAILAACVYFKWPRNEPPSVMGNIRPGSTVSKRNYEQVVNGFLRDISFQTPIFKLDVDLKTCVENSLESHGISRGLIAQIGTCIDTATEITSCTYPFASHEVQEAIALYASYVITIDDLTGDIVRGHVTSFAPSHIS